MSYAETDIPPGTVVGGDFRIVQPLAAGGMGAVYVAEQLSTARPRALKVLRRDLVGSADIVERFVLEARVAARIRSDHVVEVVSAGFDDALRVPWLAMELLEGRSLDGVLRERGHLPPAEALDVLSQVGAGLAAAHAAGVVHRDLKPENVFVAVQRDQARTVRVKILDFGIAKIVAEAHALTPMTVALGSPRWMAPEQTEASASVSPATDVWALGLVAYRVVTGRYFWRAASITDGANVAQMIREVIADPIPPASVRAAEQGAAALVPPGFDAWMARCVVRDPWARFPTAREATEALAPILLAAGAAPGRGPHAGSASAPSPAAGLPGAHAGTIAVTAASVADPRAGAARQRRGCLPWVIGGLALVGATAVVGFVVAFVNGFLDGALEEEREKPAPVAPAPPRSITGQWAIAEGLTSRGASYWGECFISQNGVIHVHEVKAFTRMNGAEVPLAAGGWGLLEGDHYAFSWSTSQAGLFVYTIAGGRLSGRIVAPPLFETIQTEIVDGSPALAGAYTITASSRGIVGTMSLRPDGARWIVERNTQLGVAQGVAVRDRDRLVVAVAPQGIQVGVQSYRVTTDAEGMVGITTDTGEPGVGREKLSRRHELPGAPPVAPRPAPRR